MDARGGEKQIGNLLNDEEELNGAAAQQTTVGKSKRGPKIDENVMVKIWVTVAGLTITSLLKSKLVNIGPQRSL